MQSHKEANSPFYVLLYLFIFFRGGGAECHVLQVTPAIHRQKCAHVKVSHSHISRGQHISNQERDVNWLLIHFGSISVFCYKTVTLNTGYENKFKKSREKERGTHIYLLLGCNRAKMNTVLLLWIKIDSVIPPYILARMNKKNHSRVKR